MILSATLAADDPPGSRTSSPAAPGQRCEHEGQGERRVPPGLYWHRGQMRVRRAGLVFDLRRLTCADGHRVAIHGRVTAGGLRCDHRAHAGAPICGAWLYLLLISSDATEHRRRRYWAADMTLAEITACEARHLALEEIIAQFGGAFPAGRAA